MMKKPSLSEALHKASKQPSPQEREPLLSSDNKLSPSQSRQGKKIIAGHFDVAVSYQIKKIALENNTSVQSLLSEAINDLLVKYSGKPTHIMK